MPGSLYRFKVSATNFVGESPLTDAIAIYAADLPEAPVSPPTVTLITETSISITIGEVPLLSNGGSAVTGYIV